MPGIVEKIAFMPPPRDECTDDRRTKLSIGRLNLEPPNEDGNGATTSIGCFGSVSSSSSPSRNQQRGGPANVDNGNNNNSNNNPAAILDDPDFDPARPYVSYTVAFPTSSGVGPRESLANGHKALLSAWNGKIILFAHGNAEDLNGVMYYWRLAQQLGVAVVAYDYLGYGWSSGTKKDCTESNAFKAIRRMFKFITDDCKRDRSKLIIMGRSLGSGSATHMAYEECLRYSAELKNKNKQQQKSSSTASSSAGVTGGEVNNNAASNQSMSTIAGLILYSPLYSAVAATGKLWASGIFGDIMCNYSKVGEIIKHCPILILHGINDEVIPFRCALELFMKCGGKPKGVDGSEATESEVPTIGAAGGVDAEQKYTGNRKAYFRPIPGCGHNNIESVMAPLYYQCLTGFISAECSGKGHGRKLGTAAVSNGGSGGFGMQAPGQASKPVVAEDDPVWGKQK